MYKKLVKVSACYFNTRFTFIFEFVTSTGIRIGGVYEHLFWSACIGKFFLLRCQVLLRAEEQRIAFPG